MSMTSQTRPHHFFALLSMREAFRGVRGDAQNQNQALSGLGRQMELLQTRMNELRNELSRIDIESLKEKWRQTQAHHDNLAPSRKLQAANEDLRRISSL